MTNKRNPLLIVLVYNERVTKYDICAESRPEAPEAVAPGAAG